MASNSLSLSRRAGTVLRWPLGMALTSWRYLWRITPLHRQDEAGGRQDLGPALPEGDLSSGVQRPSDGEGPLFHRRYAVVVHDPQMSAEELMDLLSQHPNRPAPIEVAVFRKTSGAEGPMEVGDEFVVRMPGPWDGPVRVVDRTPTSFRLATLPGHMEAGQIEFRALDDDGRLRFEIESWANSGDRLSQLLYSRIRVMKEMQLHMWTHYCEHIARIVRGQLRGGVQITTRWVQLPPEG